MRKRNCLTRIELGYIFPEKVRATLGAQLTDSGQRKEKNREMLCERILPM